MTPEDIVIRLRKRAEIRRLATCRGTEDRLANVLDEAAVEIERLRGRFSDEITAKRENTTRET